MNSERVQWIDALKGFGIFLVTFAHLNPWIYLERYIYSFHMFLFFFISGYLFHKPDSLKAYVARKAKNLLVPFLIWDILSAAVPILFREDVGDTISKFFMLNGDVSWNGSIWFLLILFVVECIYACIMKLNDSKGCLAVVMIVSAALWIMWCEFRMKKFTLLLNLIPPALFFFALGDLFKRACSDRRIGGGVSILLLAASLVFGMFLNTRISFTGGRFGIVYYCMAAGAAGTMFWFTMFQNAERLGKSRVLRVMGDHSLIIMAVQNWFFMAFGMLSEKFTGKNVLNERGTVRALITAVITISIIILIARLIKKLIGNNKKLSLIAGYLGIR